MPTANKRVPRSAKTQPGKQGRRVRGAPSPRVHVIRYLRYAALAVVAFYGLSVVALICLRFIHPITTAVQTERRLTALVRGEHYEKRYAWTPLEQISPNLQHAVVAGEDARFYLHHGFDWKEIDRALDDDREDGRLRGASTITQQLVRNLFLSTQHSFVRKAVEASIVPFAEFLLGKRRILELYLNVIEWGPGIYGAEAASHTYYRSSCATLSREQAAQLASVIPAPLRRKPGKAPAYASRILTRMRQMGW